jgi:hypothetical protein
MSAFVQLFAQYESFVRKKTFDIYVFFLVENNTFLLIIFITR